MFALVGRMQHRRGATPAAPITADRFTLTDAIDPSTLVLYAQARRPRRPYREAPAL